MSHAPVMASTKAITPKFLNLEDLVCRPRILESNPKHNVVFERLLAVLFTPERLHSIDPVRRSTTIDLADVWVSKRITPSEVVDVFKKKLQTYNQIILNKEKCRKLGFQYDQAIMSWIEMIGITHDPETGNKVLDVILTPSFYRLVTRSMQPQAEEPLVVSTSFQVYKATKSAIAIRIYNMISESQMFGNMLEMPVEDFLKQIGSEMKSTATFSKISQKIIEPAMHMLEDTHAKFTYQRVGRGKERRIRFMFKSNAELNREDKLSSRLIKYEFEKYLREYKINWATITAIITDVEENKVTEPYVNFTIAKSIEHLRRKGKNQNPGGWIATAFNRHYYLDEYQALCDQGVDQFSLPIPMPALADLKGAPEEEIEVHKPKRQQIPSQKDAEKLLRQKFRLAFGRNNEHWVEFILTNKKAVIEIATEFALINETDELAAGLKAATVRVCRETKAEQLNKQISKHFPNFKRLTSTRDQNEFFNDFVDRFILSGGELTPSQVEALHNSYFNGRDVAV